MGGQQRAVAVAAAAMIVVEMVKIVVAAMAVVGMAVKAIDRRKKQRDIQPDTQYLLSSG